MDDRIDVAYGRAEVKPTMMVAMREGPPLRLSVRLFYRAKRLGSLLLDAALFSAGWTLLTMPFWNR